MPDPIDAIRKHYGSGRRPTPTSTAGRTGRRHDGDRKRRDVRKAHRPHQPPRGRRDRKIVAAAERLAISQPALSRTVARLEARFGGRLFERIPSGVRLTSLGALATERAQRVLRELEAAEEQIEAAVTGLAGCFRISAHPVWMQAVLPAAIARFHDTFPGIELKLRAADRPEGIRLLTEAATDLHCGGIDAGEPLPPFLRRDSFVDVEAGIVARKDHPLHTRRAGLEDLAGWPWVDYDGAAPADGDAGGRASLFGVLHNLHERTGRRAGTVIRAGPAGPFPMASRPVSRLAAIEVPSCIRPRPPAPAGELRTPPLPDRLHRPALGRGPGVVPVAPTGGARRGAREKRKTAGVDRSHLSTARRMVTAPPFVATRGHVVEFRRFPADSQRSLAGCCQGRTAVRYEDNLEFAPETGGVRHIPRP